MERKQLTEQEKLARTKRHVLIAAAIIIGIPIAIYTIILIALILS